MNSLIKKPSAWIPIVMSLSALLIIISYVTIFGISQQDREDEGTAAHIFQLLLGLQIPIVLFFLIKWLPKKPKQALQVLEIQIIAAMIPISIVFILENFIN
jgi:hypothetical protein